MITLKKFTTLFVILLFTVGMAIAQNNEAIIEQIGPDNEASISQADGASAIVNQSGSTVNEGNVAYLDQAGDNTANVTQVGDNDAFIFQGTSSFFGGGAGTASGNTATVVQSGDNRMPAGGPIQGVDIYQGTDGGTAINSNATVNQDGNDNYVTVFQGIFGGGNATDLKANVVQIGNNNDGNIRQAQNAISYGDEASLTQNGSENFSSIFQGFGGGSASENNTATVTQTGNNNWAGSIYQGADLGGTGVGSGAGIAAYNTAAVLQNGSGDGTQDSGAARIFQGANGGEAFSNTALIEQHGDYNLANLRQGEGDGAISSNSTAQIFQYSESNIAESTQSGNYNNATITQN
ncbi:hypothetical protein [Rhodohalobacter sp. SW132]|uniref:hypothetical protein n=2 Tax=Rhodohalobacter sp. SW132 TaxID=2293433 RepID=UPI000E26EC83|nr:hypothetical protein [Rhodohalobacter sp. SW132]